MKIINIFVALDLEDIKWYKNNRDKYGIDKIFPLSFIAGLKLALNNYDDNDIIFPEIGEIDRSYEKSIKINDTTSEFLKHLDDSLRKYYKEDEYTFSLIDIMWDNLLVAIERMQMYLNKIVDEFEVNEIFVLNCDKSFYAGELLVDRQMFVDIIKEFAKSRNVKVKEISINIKSKVNIKKLFYYPILNVKHSAGIFYRFLRWYFQKAKIDKNILLIKPNYDCNIYYSNKDVEQANRFYENGFIYIKKVSFVFRNIIELFKPKNKNKTENNIYKISEKCSNISEFNASFDSGSMDLIKIFRRTIGRYVHDVIAMTDFVNRKWRIIRKYCKPKNIIFSVTPMFMLDHLLIKKAREENINIISWQHGGAYGYLNYPFHFFLEFIRCDYFLTYCKIEFNKIKGYDYYKNEVCETYEIGSSRITGIERKYTKSRNRKKTIKRCDGMYVPRVMAEYYNRKEIGWNINYYYYSVRKICKCILNDINRSFIVKKLKNYDFHEIIGDYIKNNSKGERIRIISDSIVDVLIKYDMDFIILDEASNPLIEILPIYKGTIFLIENQKVCELTEEAKILIKKRVIYSETVEDFIRQYNEYKRKGNDVFDCDVNNMEFINKYCSRGKVEENYDNSLKEISETNDLV